MQAFQEQTFTKRFDSRLWRSLFKRTVRYRKHMIVLALVMVAVGAIDATFPLLNRHAIDTFIVPGEAGGLLRFALVYGGLIVLQALNVFTLIAIAGKIEMGLMRDLRRESFVHIQHLSFTYFDRTPVGWLMSRLTSDVRRLGEVISWGLVDIVWGGTTMLAVATAMLILNWKLGLLVLVIVPPLVLISLVFQKRILESHRKVRKTNSEISAAFNEGIVGAPTSKTLVREEANSREFRELSGRMRRHSIHAAINSAVYLPLVLLLGSIGTGIALWAGGHQLATGIITAGTLVAFVSYSAQFFEPVREVARVLTELQSAQTAAERILGLLNTEPDIVDSPEVTKRYGTILKPKPEEWPRCTGRVEFTDVTFQYKDGQRVLEDFNLEVPAGQSIALVGETGAGKTTIVNLACRFYEPSSGQVLIDGVDYRERSIPWIQRQLGYVLQAPHLFRGTVRDNIRYGRLEATDSEVEEAARLVAAHDLIERLPNGYDTDVGEGGSGLSTGEKQLVSFARAVLANPRIFVLDEATSSVDTETEQRIQLATRTLLRGRTSFVIAHRLSTIREADRILVIENGRIVEDGTHDELLKVGGHYASLHREHYAVA